MSRKEAGTKSEIRGLLDDLDERQQWLTEAAPQPEDADVTAGAAAELATIRNNECRLKMVRRWINCTLWFIARAILKPCANAGDVAECWVRRS